MRKDGVLLVSAELLYLNITQTLAIRAYGHGRLQQATQRAEGSHVGQASSSEGARTGDGGIRSRLVLHPDLMQKTPSPPLEQMNAYLL
jgi:hypothetical protein